MPAEIIDGRKIASEIQEELKQRVAKLKEEGIHPGWWQFWWGRTPPPYPIFVALPEGARQWVYILKQSSFRQISLKWNLKGA